MSEYLASDTGNSELQDVQISQTDQASSGSDDYVVSPELVDRMMRHLVPGSGLPVVNLSSRSGSDSATVTPFRISEMVVPEWAIRAPKQLHLQDDFRNGRVAPLQHVDLLIYSRQQTETLLRGEALKQGEHGGHAPTLSLKHQGGAEGIVASGRDFSLHVQGLVRDAIQSVNGNDASITIDTIGDPTVQDTSAATIKLVIKKDPNGFKD